MLKRLRGLSVANAMVLLSVWGVLAVVAYSGVHIASDLARQSQLKHDTQLTHIVVNVSGLTHALQKERGASTGFIASGGESFETTLPRLRMESDTHIAEFRRAIADLKSSASLSEKLTNDLATIDEEIEAITVLRARVDALEASREDVLRTFTNINRDAIALLPTIGRSISYSDAARAVQRHAIFMTAKDIAGLERAIGSAGFAHTQRARSPFPRELYTRFEALISQQSALLDTYRSLSSAELHLAVDEMLEAQATKAVSDMRDTVRTFDPRIISTVTPETWFAAATGMIDLFKEVEDAGTLELAQEMSHALDDVGREITRSLLELGVIMALLSGLSVTVVRMTNESLRRAREQVEHMAEGDIDNPIDFAPQADLNALTTALEDFRQGEVRRRSHQEVQRKLEEGSAEGIRRVSHQVASGDFTHRLRTEGLKGASLVLGKGINEIMEVADAVVKEQRAKDKREIERREREADAQTRAVAAIRAVVSACSGGDFQKRMDLDGLEGVWRDVGEGVNLIAERTETSLSDLRGIMAALESGNLSERLRDDYSGTFNDIAEATNASLDQLERAFAQIHWGARSVGEAAAELRSGTGDLAKRSEVQAQAVFDSAAVTADLVAIVESNNRDLTTCRSLVEGIAAKTSDGQEISSKAIDSIAAIERASGEMVKIVGTIDEIAFQTNLLALNASVEAARAGDAGKGFGVVASEVRALAARCADASQQIARLIGDAVKGVKHGAAHVRDTGAAISEMQASMAEIETTISSVFAAGEKQTEGFVLLNASIARVEAAAQSNAALAQENNSLMTSLAELDAQLSQALAAFSTSHDPASVAAQ
ncbi:MAG: nitrate- and nitrite sensing domain-containing protein [Pseudomonadota bacterium]